MAGSRPDMTQGELIALLWSWGISVDRDVGMTTLWRLVDDPGPGPPLPPSCFDVLRRRIHKIVGVYRKQLEIDCDGDCMFCPAAQVVRCWLLSKDVVSNFEERMEGKMSKTYTFAELSVMAKGELYRIGGAEVGLDRGALYTASLPDVRVMILEKAGAPGEVEKAKAAVLAGEPETLAAPGTEAAQEAPPPEEASAEGTPEPPKEQPKKAAPKRRKQAKEGDATSTTPAGVTAESAQEQSSTEPAEGVSGSGNLPLDKFRPEDLFVEGVRRIVRGMGGSQGGALGAEIKDLRAYVAKGDGEILKAIDMLAARMDAFEKGLSGVAACLEFLMELPDVAGDTPFDRIEDMASRLR